MNVKYINFEFFKSNHFQKFIKVIVSILLAYLTVWLCNNLPMILKVLIKQFK